MKRIYGTLLVCVSLVGVMLALGAIAAPNGRLER
jgi:hypothetical protein